MAFSNLTARSRYFRLLLYTDNVQHMAAFDAIKKGYAEEYVGIVHRAQEGIEKEHVHIVLCFVNPRVTSSVCQVLGFLDALGAPDDQFVRAIVKEQSRKVDQQLKSCCVYLTHRNAPEKEQYSPDDLFGTKSRVDWVRKQTIKYESNEFDMSDCVLAALDWIQAQDDEISVATLARYLANSPYWKCNNNKFLWACLREHNLKIYHIKNPVPEHFDTLMEYNEKLAFDLSEFELMYGG